MTEENQVDTLIHKKRDGKRIVLAEGKASLAKRPPIGRLPRITRYMALASYRSLQPLHRTRSIPPMSYSTS